MKRISMLLGAAAVVLSIVSPASAADGGAARPIPTPAPADRASDPGCWGPLTFETLTVTTRWPVQAVTAGTEAKVSVTVTRTSPEKLTGNDLPHTPQVSEPVEGARVATAIYLPRGYRWATGVTNEDGRATLEVVVPRTNARWAVAATGADFMMGPRMDCGISEVGFARDELSIRR